MPIKLRLPTLKSREWGIACGAAVLGAGATAILVIAFSAPESMPASYSVAAVDAPGSDAKNPARSSVVDSQAAPTRAKGSVKVIGASPPADMPCESQTWPFIEGRCLTAAPPKDKRAGPPRDVVADRQALSPLTSTGAVAPRPAAGPITPNESPIELQSPRAEPEMAPPAVAERPAPAKKRQLQRDRIEEPAAAQEEAIPRSRRQTYRDTRRANRLADAEEWVRRNVPRRGNGYQADGWEEFRDHAPLRGERRVFRVGRGEWVD